jgi:ArsR family transcriptional regulator
MELNMLDERKRNTAALDEQAQVFKLLTHPARIAILNLLRDGEHCVCHLEAYLGFRQSYISQQLAVMREAGIIQDRRDGGISFTARSTPKYTRCLTQFRNSRAGLSISQMILM